ncbi:MAG: hypothetical protein V3T28_04090 [Gemmatimonadales bacterium]
MGRKRAEHAVCFAARVTTGHATPANRAVALYYAVRDGIIYDLSGIDLRPERGAPQRGRNGCGATDGRGGGGTR